MKRQSSKPMPTELMNWSWTAFLTPWSWTFDNHIGTYPSSRGGLFKIGPLFGPRPFWFLGRYGLIYLGRNGNKLAWRSRNWKSVEEFKKAQRRTLIKGMLIYFVVPMVVLASVVIAVVLQVR